MQRRKESRYIRYNQPTEVIRRWIAILLLKADLEGHFVFGSIDRSILSGFDVASLNKDNHQDAEFMRSWLKVEQKRCLDRSFDEEDVFAINTRNIKVAMGLNEAELAILRFACLLNSYTPMDGAADICGTQYTEVGLCDLLSELLGKPFGAIYDALHPTGLLRRSGLLRQHFLGSNSQRLNAWLSVPEVMLRQVFRDQGGSNILLEAFYQTGPKSTLAARDFSYMRKEVALIKQYLRTSFKSSAIGANVLLWGAPGTGKTELARYLAQSLRKRSLEVNTINSDNEAMSVPSRLDCYRFCQGIIRRGGASLIVFDEVEEVLCNANFARMGFKDDSKVGKGLINKILEENNTPAIWITNTVDGVDPAYLRRFDMVQQLKTPLPATKKRMARRVFKDLPLDSALVDQIAEHKAITPAHLQKITRICNRLGVETTNEAANVVNQVLNGDLAAIRAKPINTSKLSGGKKPSLTYKPSLINCDTDIEQIGRHLNAGSSARMCLFGPPGTGKTAWARYVARAVKRPLLVKQAADLLNEYVGGTEKRIRAAFEEATRTKSILLFDEVDSFLPDRKSVSQHWEVSQANQFLTALEEFNGVLLCTTNLMDNLDPATMRRFDFKISFDYLKPEQALEMAMDFCRAFKVPVTKQGRVMLEANLGRLKLAQGDFAALLRRYSVMNDKPKVRKLCEELKKEVGFREEVKSRPIGFVT